MRPIVVVLIAIGLGTCLLLGWAVAWYYDQKARRREREEREAAEAFGDSPAPD